MKAKLFVAALATLAFASCSETETVEMPSSAAIKFDNAFVGNSVRAAINDAEGLKAVGFKVFGGFSDGELNGVFNDVAVNFTDGAWKSTTTEYWQNGKSYVFQAYSGTASAKATVNGVEFTGYVANGTEDLLSAAVVEKPTVNVTAPGTVDFTFRHVLSQVKFTFVNGFSGNVDLTIDNVKVNGLATTGNYTLSDKDTGAWGELSGSSAYSTNISGAAIEAGKNAATESVIVMPQDVNGKTVTFDLVVSGSLDFEKQTITVTLPEKSMLEGHSYNFTATLNASNIKDPENPDQTLKPIEFGVQEVTAWNGEEAGGDGTVNQ